MYRPMNVLRQPGSSQAVSEVGEVSDFLLFTHWDANIARRILVGEMYGSWLYINKGETTDFTVFTDCSMKRVTRTQALARFRRGRVFCAILFAGLSTSRVRIRFATCANRRGRLTP